MMKKYNSYKDSGVEWLGEIPEHWEALSNKYIFNLKKNQVGKNSDNYVLLSLTLRGLIVRNIEDGGKFPADFDTYQEVNKGDFVFCLFDVEETPRCVGLSKHDGMITGAYTVLVPNDNFERGFLYYFYLNLDLDKRLKPLYTGLRNTISKDNFFSFKTFVPPLQEQTAIAKFLDDKTTKIEQAIAIKQQQIALLKERKQILIHKAVTRGLDDSVPLKDSGVEWIGEIPEHWEVKKFTWLTSVITQGGNPNYDLGEVSDNYAVLKTKSLYDHIIYYNEADKISEQTYKQEEKSWLQNGDLLVAIVGKGSIGKVNVFEKQENVNFIYSRSLGCIRFYKMVSPYYVKYLFQTERGQEIINLDIKGSTGQEVLQTTFFKNLKIQLPPINEQNQIVNYIEKSSAKIDTAIGLKEQEISKLQEYKSSLINSVVTGKVRVC